MLKNPFFKNKGPFKLPDLIYNSKTGLNSKNEVTSLSKDILISDVKNLNEATKNDITFFHSANYKEFAQSTKAFACITKEPLSQYLPAGCVKICVDNVLLLTAQVTEQFYPDSITDDNNYNLEPINDIFSNIISGHNTFVGPNVQIGNSTRIGHNTIIEQNVSIGNNCSIGSNVILRNTFLEDNVHVLDSAIVGKKGFGFIPIKSLNYRYPHIGYVHIKKNSEIGAGSTIDRGSLSVTVIGENTYLDNQVHIAHNVKIGNNCIIAGQVGIAGSVTLGNNVMIGGQAGISGHLKIGNNVQIGGGSGVIKNIPDNTKVMGYPATEIKNFLKESKK
tara:strand:- start:1343 stop:2341 length:999 start_codon:yes stop_codon:yes gene_type:complete